MDRHPSKNHSLRRKVPTTFIDAEDFHLDCPAYQFIPTVLPPVDRIIVLGDIHSDLRLAVESFKLAGLIDNRHNWTADPPNTVVVQVGDQIDGCRPGPGNNCHLEPNSGTKQSDRQWSSDMSVINFFNQMHLKAAKVGGAVYSLLGNHELMNATGDFRYVNYADHEKFDYEIDGVRYVGPSGRKAAFEPGSGVSSMLACTRNSVMIIGSNMFVHAGVLPALIDSIQDVDFDSHTKLKYLNSIMRKWLLNKMAEMSEADKQNVELFLDEKGSPFWTRIFGKIKPGVASNIGECDQIVKSTLQVFKIGKIIVGHTPQLFVHGTGINGTCYEKDQTGALWRVDGGFSKAFGAFGPQNIIQVLEITADTNFKVLTQAVPISHKKDTYRR